MTINFESQKKELQDINNQLTLLMKKKKAIQEYLKEETDRMMGIKSKEAQILELYNDPKFIKENGRRRYYWEIGNIVGYSQSAIQQFFSTQKKTK
jgi:hypothetical protein